MAKVSPVSIKYMIHAGFTAEGALEKPDVIGALFGQTEGLLGADLEMRELQKEGKIGRIEVDLERAGKQTIGKIKIPTALDQSETTLIAAAIETIERIGPSDSTIEVERIEDVRGSKRDYIIERAKKLMKGIEGSTDSREISNQIKTSSRMGEIGEFGEDKVPCGDLSDKEIIVVEGRADVVNLMKNGVRNVVAMNGTKLPRGIKELSEEKDIILFIDGDRGGKLIVQNVSDNAKVKYVASAPDGKEVEELTGKEILMNLRKKVSLADFLRWNGRNDRYGRSSRNEELKKESAKIEKVVLSESDRENLEKIFKKNESSGKAILLSADLGEIRKVSARGLALALKKSYDKPAIIVLDGTVTNAVVEAAEESGVGLIAANNFATTNTKIELLSF